MPLSPLRGHPQAPEPALPPRAVASAAALAFSEPASSGRLGTRPREDTMAIVTKRNALIGWLVVKLGKRAAKKKAQATVPSARTGGLAAGTLAAVGGALLFWHKKRGAPSAAE